MQLDRKRLLLLAGVTEGIAFAFAVALAAWMDIPLYPRHTAFFSHLLIGILWTIPPLLLFFFLMSGRASGMRMLGSLRRKTLTDIRPLFARARPPDLVLIALIAGIAEECFFRGIVQTTLGIVPASVIFGLFHVVTPFYAVVATAMGLYLGLLFSMYDSLTVPVQVHFLYDLGALLYLRYGVFSEDDRDVAVNRRFMSGHFEVTEKGDS